jgi:hypothetical protein
MKANLKGLGNVKGLLLAHGEKLGIAAVGICAVMFVYSSLSHEPLPDRYQASRLKSEIDQVSREVREFTWASASPEDVRMARPLARGEDIMVQPKWYEISAWDPPVIRPTVLRKDPVLLQAVDVEVNTGAGLLAFLDPDLAERRRLQEEQEKQEQEKEQEALRERNQEDTRTARGRNRNQPDEPVDREHPNRRPVSSGVPPAGVSLSGMERVETAYWAVVVAKVPIREQLKLYREVLANARDHDPQYDTPQYIGYVVERVEVLPGQQPLDWTKVNVYDGQRRNIDIGKKVSTGGVTSKVLESVSAEWGGAGGVMEVVDDRFFDPDFVLPFPLPPLVGRDWGDDVTHSDIPLIEEDEGLDASEDEMSADSLDTPTVVDDSELWNSNNAQTTGRGRGVASGRGNPRGSTAMRGDMSRAGSRGRGREGFSSREMMGHGGMGGRSTSGMVVAQDVSFWLLRFFDFDVEPGKKYKYRVRLALVDVNSISTKGPGRRVDKDALDSTVLTRLSSAKGPKGIRFTDPSAPSPTVGIPLAGDVRVAGANAANARLHNDEPRLNLMVTSFGVDEENQAFQAVKEKEGFRRGNVANMTEGVEVLVEQGDYIDEIKSFDFRTGITVVDIRGGERLSRSRKLSAPAQALLMDPTGQLYVRREVKDIGEVEHHRMLFSEEERGSRNAFPDGGRGGMNIRGGR